MALYLDILMIQGDYSKSLDSTLENLDFRVIKNIQEDIVLETRDDLENYLKNDNQKDTILCTFFNGWTVFLDFRITLYELSADKKCSALSKNNSTSIFKLKYNHDFGQAFSYFEKGKKARVWNTIEYPNGDKEKNYGKQLEYEQNINATDLKEFEDIVFVVMNRLGVEYNKLLNNKFVVKQVMYGVKEEKISANNNEEEIKRLSGKIKLNPKNKDLYFERGTKYTESKLYEKAIADFTVVLEIESGNERALMKRGFANYNRYSYQNAKADYSMVIKLNPVNEKAWFNRGLCFDKLGDYELALADFSKSLEIKPDFDKAFYSRGLVFNKLKRYNDARHDFTKAMDLNPSAVKAYFLGLVNNKLCNFKEALTILTKSIEYSAKDSDAFIQRGFSHYYLNEFEAALHDFNQALVLEPKSNQAFMGIARVNKALGKADEAIKFEKKIDLKSAAWKGEMEVFEYFDETVTVWNKVKPIKSIMNNLLMGRNYEIMKLLINKGVDVNYTDSEDVTILMHAAMSDDVQFVKFLIEKGAEINLRSSQNNTALILACGSSNKNTLEIIKLLIENGADKNIKHTYGYGGSCFLQACFERNLETIKYLYEIQKMDLHETDQNETTALMQALRVNPKFEVVKYLVENGCDVNARNKQEETALMYAVNFGDINIIQYLIDKKADLLAKDKYDNDILKFAERNKDKKIAEYIKNQEVNKI